MGMCKICLYVSIVCQSFVMAMASESSAQRKYLKDISVELSIENSYGNIKLVDLIAQIEKKVGFNFAYSKKDVRGININLSKGKTDLGSLCKAISVQGRFSISRVNETITLVRATKEKGLLPALAEQIIQRNEITGSVRDENGEPLPGATIIEKGTTDGTSTDADGNFRLRVSEGAVLSISFIGYATQEVAVNGRSVIEVSMELELENLQEVVVIGYGTVEREDITGAVAGFDSKSLDRLPANNLTELMRASVPGLNVGISTNAEGSSDLLVRGRTSLGASNDPLLVVDDVIFQGDLSSIDPADIESVNVLKDASAAAVYGSRAAAGVIMITTKKGTTGKPTINVRSSIGWATPNEMLEVWSPEKYVIYRGDVFEQIDIAAGEGYYDNPNNLPSGVTLNDWLDYDGLAGTTTDPVDIWLGRLEMSQNEIENYKAGRTLDWEDLIFQNGFRHNNTISVSGKTDRLSYYTSLGYVRNEGIQIFQEYQALRGRVNLEMEVNDFITMGTNLQGSTQEQPASQGLTGRGGTVPNTEQAYHRQSPYGDLFYQDDPIYEDGSIRHLPFDDALAANPFLYEYEDNLFRQRELFSNLYAKVKLPFGFSYRVNWSNRIAFDQDYRFDPVIRTLGEAGDQGSRTEVFSRRWMVDNIFNWNKTFNDIHSFDLTFLVNVEEAETWTSRQSNSTFSPNDRLSYHNLAIGANPILVNNDTRETADALMGRLNYGLLDRYYLTLTLRRDGYSAFGSRNPRATFPAVSAAWRVSDEAFLSGVDVIDNLKLRVSWGANGNRAIGTYSALSRLAAVNYIYDQSTVFGVSPSDLANQNLKWESTTSFNVGLDFGLFNSRINGSIDVYENITDDLLLPRSLPEITGYGSVFANLGEVQNNGVELTLNSVNVDKNDFYWGSNLSFWFNRNKINHLYGDMVDVLDENGNVIGQREEDDIQNDWYIGHAIDEIFDYDIIGIWQLDEEDEAEQFGKVPGDVKLRDVNGDGVIDFDDQVFQGFTDPRYRISLRNDFTYKNFDLSILINSLLDYKGRNNLRFNSEPQQQRYSHYAKPYWTEDNPTNEWARLSSNNDTPVANWYDNRSFVRVQNLTIGYTVPRTILERLQIQKLRVYANFQNFKALSLGDWEFNWDVETRNPTPLITTFGLDLSF